MSKEFSVSDSDQDIVNVKNESRLLVKPLSVSTRFKGLQYGQVRDDDLEEQYDYLESRR